MVVKKSGERWSIIEEGDRATDANLERQVSHGDATPASLDTQSNGDGTRTVAFRGNGIVVKIRYPKRVHSGETFKIHASMTNQYRRARQGGLTLSFLDMVSMSGRAMQTNFSKATGYSYPSKIWNRNAKKALPAEYFMVEGWQERPWHQGETKRFSVMLTVPQGSSKLRVNVRGILWIRNSHDTRNIPSSSFVYDQQGFAVKQFVIDVEPKEIVGKKSFARVSGIRWNDTLAVRSGPSTRYRCIGDLPPDATGVQILECSRRWCRIRYGNLVGWSYNKYLRSY